MKCSSGIAIIFFVFAYLQHVQGNPCNDPGDIFNGRKIFQKQKRLVQFVCDPGFQVNGNSLLSCVRGLWKGDRPICVVSTCPKLKRDKHAHIEVNRNGTFVEFTCKDNYTIKGDSKRLISCNGQRWNYKQPKCIKIRRQFRILDRFPSLTLTSSPVTVASPTTTERRLNCPSPQRPKRGYHITRPLPPEFTDDNYVYYIEYHCLPGLTRVSGDNTSYCLKTGKWSGTVPECQDVAGCVAGFKRIPPGECTDINECNLDNGGCSHQCINKLGSYVCRCPRGYQLSVNSHSCIDIDECTASMYICNQICTNLPGSFECSCNEGFFLFPYDNRTCLDVNECLPDGRGPCEHFCMNTYGGYKCACARNSHLNSDQRTCSSGGACNPGFRLEVNTATQQRSCVDIDECGVVNTHFCEEICVNSYGSYHCSCNGNRLLMSDGYSCTEKVETTESTEIHGRERIECSPSTEICSPSCHEVNGLPLCNCPPGFIIDYTVGLCKDINECMMPNQCREICVNSFGNYHCSCYDNRILLVNGYSCGERVTKVTTSAPISAQTQETNEIACLPGVARCPATCVVPLDRRTCVCPNGYSLDPDVRMCQDVNECVTTNLCQDICINALGSYKCGCFGSRVLSSDGFSCMERVRPTTTVAPLPTRIECDGNEHQCSANCVDVYGRSTCTCPLGYALDDNNGMCDDIDECLSLGTPCERSTCNNTVGSYRCVCEFGFQPDSRDQHRCIDTNECLQNNGGCEQLCFNLVGNYNCSCQEGYSLTEDGKSCETITLTRAECEPLSNPDNGVVLPKSLCLGDRPLLDGRVCLFTCNRGYEISGPNRRVCSKGVWSGSQPVCEATELCPVIIQPNNTEIFPPSCTQQKSRRWKLCMFHCRSGFSMVGSSITRCGPNQKWVSDPPECVATFQGYITPKIQCPPNIEVNLNSEESVANVTVSEPISNMNIIEQRGDGRTQLDIFPAGVTVIKFTAFSDNRLHQASCEVTVVVRDKTPPVVERCPPSITIPTSQKYAQVTWAEPMFSDNVQVENVELVRVPSGRITWGTYRVTYTASDAAANKVDCTFTVTVRSTLSCIKPEGPTNGRVQCKIWLKGMFCEASCNRGYKFESPPAHAYVCTDKKWSPSSDIPNCIRDYRSRRRNVTANSRTRGRNFISSNSRRPNRPDYVRHKTKRDIRFDKKFPVCAEGSFISTDNYACKKCPISFFQGSKNSFFCLPCPEHQTTLRIGSTSKGDCVDEQNSIFK